MSDPTDQETLHRRPHPQSLAAAYLEFDLAREIEQLQREPKWTAGENAKRLLKYDDFRVVLMELRAHARVPTHQTEGRISLQTIRGHIQVRAARRRLICQWAACSRSIGVCRTTLRRSRKACCC